MNTTSIASLGDYVRIEKIESLGEPVLEFLYGLEGKVGKCVKVDADVIYVQMLDWDVTVLVKHGNYVRVAKTEKWEAVTENVV